MPPGTEESKHTSDPIPPKSPKERLLEYTQRKLDQKDKGLITNEELIETVGKIYDAYKALADRDPLLTNFLNQGSFPRAVEKELAIIKRYNLGGAYFLIDVDKFKEINDNLGHNIGDQVLIAIGKMITNGTRTTDLLGYLKKEGSIPVTKPTATKGRIGGDEMAVLLTGADGDGAKLVAERIREKIPEILRAIIPNYSGEQKTSISVGIAVISKGNDTNETAESLKERADKALYLAKDQGRNQVVIAEDTRDET